MSKQRYEKEIEEILAKYDQETGRKTKTAREEQQKEPVYAPRTYANRAPGKSTTLPNWRRISAGQYILAAFAVALLAIFVRDAVPVLASILVIVSVALFIMPIVVYYRTGTSTGGWPADEQKRWRGQVIDFNTRRRRADNRLASIKRWFKRR